MNKKQSGWTIMSTLATLVIIVIVLGFAYKMISKANEDAEALVIIKDIRTIVNNAVEIRTTEEEGLYGARLKSRGMVPVNWQEDPNSDGWFDTRWGRASIGGIGNWFNENPPGFTGVDGVHLFMNRIPGELCYQIVSTLQTEMDYISINAGNGLQGNYMMKTWNVPYDRATTLAACDSEFIRTRGYFVLRTAVFK